MSNRNYELAWDSLLEEESPQARPLPEGQYPFEVVDVRRCQFQGNERMSASPKAVVTLRVMADQRTVTVYDDLILNQSVKWKLILFFSSIGLKKPGIPYRMDWDAVPGRHGTADVIIREYQGRDGRLHRRNQVRRYLPCPDAPLQEQAGGKAEDWKAESFPAFTPADDETPFDRAE